MFVIDVSRASCDAYFASPAFGGLSSVSPARTDRDPRAAVLPPVQPASSGSASDEMESPDSVDRLPSWDDDDDLMPPVVRFKNRYRRAQLLEEQQRHECYETTRDWNDNETTKVREVKTNWSPVEDRHAADDVYHDASPPKILPDPDLVRCSVDERRAVVEESRTCEKRTWSRVTPEVDLSDQWMSSCKMPCRDSVVDSRRTDADRQMEKRENDELLKQYQQIHQKNLEYRNCVDSRAEMKCEPRSVIVFVLLFLLQQWILCLKIFM